MVRSSLPNLKPAELEYEDLQSPASHHATDNRSLNHYHSILQFLKFVLMFLSFCLWPIYASATLRNCPECSFGFQKQRSAYHALESLRTHIMRDRAYWVLDVDIQKYFDTIDHGQLRQFLARRVVDGVVRKLIVSS